jgi:hypothetical protein
MYLKYLIGIMNVSETHFQQLYKICCICNLMEMAFSVKENVGL